MLNGVFGVQAACFALAALTEEERYPSKSLPGTLIQSPERELI